MNGRMSSACEQDGQWQVAVQLYERMLQQHVSPTVVTFSALVSVCEKGRAWQAAKRMFKAMQASGMSPNHYTWGALMSALEKGGQFEEVRHTSTLYCSRGWVLALARVPDLSLGIDTALNLTVWRRALHALHIYSVACQTHPRLAFRPACYTFDVSVTLSSRTCGGARVPTRHTRQLEATWRAMQAAGMPPTEYVYSARIIAAAKQVRRTYSLWNPRSMHCHATATPALGQHVRICSCGPLSVCCGVLVWAQGHVEMAEKLFDEMRVAGLAPTVVTCTNLLVAQVCGSVYLCWLDARLRSVERVIPHSSRLTPPHHQQHFS
jgi:pentatricopeptide repeat protein